MPLVPRQVVTRQDMRAFICGKSGGTSLTLLRHLAKNVMRCGAMQIACPNCHVLYEVPDSLLGSGSRRLRCEECSYGWRLGREDVASKSASAISVSVEHEPKPEPASVDEAQIDDALGRHFGEPADAQAKAEMQVALKNEAIAHQPPQDEALPLPPAAVTEADRFADLVRAARNNEVELEPDQAPKRLRHAGKSPLIRPLILVLLLALIVLERHAVIRVIPATAVLFHALHLS